MVRRRRQPVRRLLVVALMAGMLPSAAAWSQPAGSTGQHVSMPVQGEVLRAFEPPASPYGAGHRGVALQAPPGAVVGAAMAGVVSFSGEVARAGWVTVDHGGGLDTTYGVLDVRLVRAGEHVRAGQPLGLVAEDAPHLHWGARLHGEYVDPLALLRPWRARLVPL